MQVRSVVASGHVVRHGKGTASAVIASDASIRQARVPRVHCHHKNGEVAIGKSAFSTNFLTPSQALICEKTCGFACRVVE